MLITDIQGLNNMFNAVEIKMIDRLFIPVEIFVDDGKGGAGHFVGNPQHHTNSLDKSCLSCSHLPKKCKNTLISMFLQQIGSYWCQFIQGSAVMNFRHRLFSC